MQLYIGGYAQGKLAYVQEKLKGQKVPVVNDLHLWVKQLLQEGKPAEEIVLQYYKEHRHDRTAMHYGHNWDFCSTITVQISRICVVLYSGVLF